MSLKLFTAALLASTLLATPALAQSDPPMQPRQPAAAAPASAPTTQNVGQWRATKFVGLNVYNANNEKIGDIKDLIIDASGDVDLIVVGVGGFLGMGEHNVGLAWDQVKFMNEAPSQRSTSRTDGVTTTGTSARVSATPRDYPDHAIVNMTKDQLKSLPAFKYASEIK